MKKIYHLLLLFLPVILLTACEIVPEESTQSVEWKKHEGLLTQITHYRASGKLGYKSPEVKQSLNFIWDHSPKESHLRLTTFLGQTVLNLYLTENGAKVIDKEGKEFQDKNATLLIYRLTGFVIPVTYMQDWIKGLPTDADNFGLNEQTGTLASLTKKMGRQNWTLNYQSYQNVDMIPLPYSMNLTQADTTLKVVVSKWKITP